MGQRAFWAIALGLSVLLIVAWQSGAIPTYDEYCQTDEATHQKDCATYHVALVALFKIGKTLHEYGE
jgi:hypothetical protein